jgi:two-component system chemotaxis response regulator CheB
MGRDGLRGCEVLKEAGAEVLVQDEATSVVWGMPGFVARAGLADEVLPLSKIAAEVVRRAGRRCIVPSIEQRGEAASLRRSCP